jgi:Endoribonuclease L-PSP
MPTVVPALSVTGRYEVARTSEGCGEQFLQAARAGQVFTDMYDRGTTLMNFTVADVAHQITAPALVTAYHGDTLDVPVGASDIAAQTREVLDRIGRALAEVGATLDHVVRTRLFVTDMSAWGGNRGRAQGVLREGTARERDLRSGPTGRPARAHRDRSRRHRGLIRLPPSYRAV